MKLTDIKKLKVAELRVRLAELGLDSKGLKAELVGRLWSVLAAEPSEKTKEEEEKLQSDTSVKLVVPADLTLPSSSDEACVTMRSKADKSRKVTNTGTQTEPEPAGEPQGAESSSQNTRAELELKDSTGEGTEDPPLDISKGRAFYEFKEEVKYKRAKLPQSWSKWKVPKESDENKVRLDPYACHLHFEISPDGSGGQPRYWDRFPLIWCGCRLTHGVDQGRVSFEVRLDLKLTAQLKDQRAEEPCLRVGWSVTDASLLLGEDELSFAYDGSGKKVSGRKEERFGEAFSEGDIIGCYASFSTNGTVELSFHKNGCHMGIAFSLKTSTLQGRALFPHILLKSCVARVNLDPTSPTWYPGPAGFTPLAAFPVNQMFRSAPAPTSREQCEVVVMVGFPGSGKSFWAHRLMKENPEKRYRLLGTEELLKCMMSGGLKENRLQQASQCLTNLIEIATVTPGNYILDQCNILISARRYKLQLFAGFRRQVVVVFPSADEWRRRLLKQQISHGERIPEIALLKLQVSCSLPEADADVLEELHYVELPHVAAQKLLEEHKSNARRLLPPMPKEMKKHHMFKRRLHFRGYSNTRLNTQVWSQQPGNWSVPYPDRGCYNNRNYAYCGYGGFY